MLRVEHHHFHHSDAETERKLDLILGAVTRLIKQERIFEMARKEIDDALIAEIARNTDAVSAGTVALNTLTATNADLIKQLEDAQNNGDDDQIQSAIDALKANNAALIAATPKIAEAIPANT